MRRKIEPNIAKNSSVMPALAAVKRGFFQNDVSSIGLGVYDSHHANAPSTTSATANAARMLALVQPRSGAWMMP